MVLERRSIVNEPQKSYILRGLKAMVFVLMSQESQSGNELGRLDNPETFDIINAKVSEAYPMSKWVTNAKTHYAYYKSKFKSSVHIPQ